MKTPLARGLLTAALLLSLRPVPGRAAGDLCADQTVTLSSGSVDLGCYGIWYGYTCEAVPVRSYPYPDLIPGATWIWSEDPPSPDHLATGDQVWFWTAFQVPAGPPAPTTTLRITAADGFWVWVNGVMVADSGYPYDAHDRIDAPGDWQWNHVRTYDLTGAVASGENNLFVWAWNGAWGAGYETWNPAGLVFQLTSVSQPCEEVGIDVKPGSFPNALNLGSGGSVAVAILGAPGFDASAVDPLTVTLASAPIRLRGKGEPMASVEDVNGDGLGDLVVHVSTAAFQLSGADETALLEARTYGGLLVRGADTVRVVP